jgi:hypothetical protein
MHAFAPFEAEFQLVFLVSFCCNEIEICPWGRSQNTKELLEPAESPKN